MCACACVCTPMWTASVPCTVGASRSGAGPRKHAGLCRFVLGSILAAIHTHTHTHTHTHPTALNNLNGVRFMGKTLQLSMSKHREVALPRPGAMHHPPGRPRPPQYTNTSGGVGITKPRAKEEGGAEGVGAATTSASPSAVKGGEGEGGSTSVAAEEGATAAADAGANGGTGKEKGMYRNVVSRGVFIPTPSC